jgi:hypothetical protein
MYCEGVLQVRLLWGAAAERDGEQLPLPPPAGRLLALLAVRPGSRDREAGRPGEQGRRYERLDLRSRTW